MATALNLKTQYNKEIIPKLKEVLKQQNPMALPKVEKITVNVGMGTYLRSHSKDYGTIEKNITMITGQKPVLTIAKKSVSNFKIREGMVIGAKVTLRDELMYSFLNKLIHVVFPRMRDFRGLSPRSFDGNGNYSVGFKEHTVFPEISPDDVINLHGLQVIITTSATNDDEGFALLKEMGFPFQKQTN